MSARSDLKALLEVDAPDNWEIFDYPTNLRTFDDPAKTVAVVIEQRGITAARFSPDDSGTPIETDFILWVAVDATRGESMGEVEDALEAAAEQMIRLLEPLPDSVWDGAATRDAYTDQHPAYQFPLTGTGRITETE